MLRTALATGSVKTAVEAVAAATGHKRRLVYQRASPWRGRTAMEPPERDADAQPEAPDAASRSASGCRRRAAPPPFSSPRAIASWPAASALPAGEIDIVARRRSTLIFVEVKARESFDAAAEAIGPRQRQRIIAAAGIWLASHPLDASRDMRFDVILVAPHRLPRHLSAAFDASA